MSSVRTLFGKSLSPPLLLDIVDSIQNVLCDISENPSLHHSEARALITALPSVDRFAMLVALLDRADKEKIAKLLQTLGVARSAWGL